MPSRGVWPASPRGSETRRPQAVRCCGFQRDQSSLSCPLPRTFKPGIPLCQQSRGQERLVLSDPYPTAHTPKGNPDLQHLPHTFPLFPPPRWFPSLPTLCPSATGAAHLPCNSGSSRYMAPPTQKLGPHLQQIFSCN